jgi:hypothetical protein
LAATRAFSVWLARFNLQAKYGIMTLKKAWHRTPRSLLSPLEPVELNFICRELAFGNKRLNAQEQQRAVCLSYYLYASIGGIC